MPWLLVWDNNPPHHTRIVREAADAAGIELVFLPFRAPELNPCEDLWRPLKGTVAANRCDPEVDQLAQRAVRWLDDHPPAEIRRIAGLTSSKFDWLPT